MAMLLRKMADEKQSQRAPLEWEKEANKRPRTEPNLADVARSALSQVADANDKKLIRRLPDPLAAHFFTFLSLRDIQHGVDIAHGRRVQLGTVSTAAGAQHERRLIVPLTDIVIDKQLTDPVEQDEEAWRRICDLLEHSNPRRLSVQVSKENEEFLGAAGLARWTQVQTLLSGAKSQLDTFELEIIRSNWSGSYSPIASITPILALPTLRHLKLKIYSPHIWRGISTQLIAYFKAAKPQRLETVDLTDWGAFGSTAWVELFAEMKRPPTTVGLCIQGPTTQDDRLWVAIAKNLPTVQVLRLNFENRWSTAPWLGNGLVRAIVQPTSLLEFEVKLEDGRLHPDEKSLLEWRRFTRLRKLIVPVQFVTHKILDVWSSEMKLMEHFESGKAVDMTERDLAILLEQRWPDLRICKVEGGGEKSPFTVKEEALAFVKRHPKLTVLPSWCKPVSHEMLREWTVRPLAALQEITLYVSSDDEVKEAADCVRVLRDLRTLVIHTTADTHISLDPILVSCAPSLVTVIAQSQRQRISDTGVRHLARSCPLLNFVYLTDSELLDVSVSTWLELVASAHHLNALIATVPPEMLDKHGLFVMTMRKLRRTHATRVTTVILNGTSLIHDRLFDFDA